MDLLCMDGADSEVSMACMCSNSNRSCPYCWYPDSQLDDTQSTCKYRRAKEVFAQLDAAREQLPPPSSIVVNAQGHCQESRGSGFETFLGVFGTQAPLWCGH